MNHFKEIIKVIKDKEKYLSIEQSFQSSIFRHLIELMGEEYFNNVFDVYFVNRVSSIFDSNFYDFHKSMRQCDFYNEYYRRIDGKDKNGKKITEYENIGGHLDMLFWNFIQISEIPYLVLQRHMKDYESVKEFIPNIGKKVTKCSITDREDNNSKFKSGLLENTIKGLTIHEFLETPAYTFEEDESNVECRRCKIVENEINEKSNEHTL